MTDISSLVAFKKLAVKDLLVEPKRIKATYALTLMDGTEAQNELIYSYDKVWFDPRSSADVNLASMMAAQVAINYGLFCETLEFDGLYDAVDKRFITDMVENTSREIFVNRFLLPNEFILPPYNQIEARQMQRYTQAKLSFVNTDYSDLPLPTSKSQPDLQSFAILSSGGKDSLLTYGLVRELGEPHPVFINESGRHWFTAINAHKHLKDIEPNTAKPWCNSDRMFNWMVRHMPFVRKDFANVRADIYPIRLWTVAVFLFGVLPVARKRNAGNILIGNEYDTTMKGAYKGITHYQALYDQSKYFDNALTRYYRKKGWGIYQYSMLRSLSELLILKILIKRYPELQRHQVSCHAAHQEGDRMLPCGNCEKCRRIIGMITALDEDPQRCGYTSEQIERGLRALEQKSVKQFGADAAHLFYLLMERNAIASNEHTQRVARAHPEILKLRFDKERSSITDLPAHVRKPLLNLFLEHADGTARWQDRAWHDMAITEEFLDQPYIAEST